MRLLVIFILSVSFLNSCGSTSDRLITKDAVRKLLENPPKNQEKLKQKTFNGCIAVPAKNLLQRLFVGLEFTGETCSVTVHQNNNISVSFLGNAVIPLVSEPSTIRTVILIGDLKDKDNNIIVVQHHQGDVVDVTHTFYDKNNGTAFQLRNLEYVKSCTHLTSEGKRDCTRK